MASVKNDDRLFAKADKTTNFYKLDIPEYKQLLEANITKSNLQESRQEAAQYDG